MRAYDKLVMAWLAIAVCFAVAIWAATCTGRAVDDDVFETMDRGVKFEVADGGWI